MAELRVALVSGANRGIGREISRQLARQGIMVAMGCRDLAKGKEAADDLRSEGLEPAVVALDVTQANSVNNAVGEVMKLFGRIDILVNNAAIMHDGASSSIKGVSDIPAQLVMQTFETNVVGPLLLTQAVLPHMRKQGYGRIVNLSSGLGQLEEMGTGHTAYRISKTALNALTRNTAAELGQVNIKVNSMCPGWVRTDMGGPNALLPVEKGAETAIWLATLDEDGPTGGYFQKLKPIAW